MPDPLYAHRPYPKQHQKPVRRIDALTYPTLGLPVLLPYCGRFVIRVHTGTGILKRSAWKAELFTKWDRPSSGQRIALRVVRVDRLRPKTPIVRLHVALPVSVGRDVYHLRVTGPDGVDDRQPRAVRVYGRLGRSFRFVVMGDHQLWDPSWKVRPGHRNNRGFPYRGQTDHNKAITLQGIREVELLDPVFVIYPGDFLFGLNFRKEYREMWQWWHQSRFATFMVPGNHDAYAHYQIRFRGNWRRLGVGFLACRKVFPRKADWWKIWRYLACVYKDVKEVLFNNLVHDGLVSWARTFGPSHYAFELGPYYFIGLNTYDGTNRRRHAFSLWMSLRGLRLGAPAVDNYGGYLSVKQLEWIKKQAASAVRRGKTVVFFGHHDPQGNPEKKRYHANEPFPTDPVGLDHFEEWNYDGPKWDSNPKDGRGTERTFRNTGIALLRIVAKYGSYYISGHVHEDLRKVYQRGEAILPGIKARRRLAFVRVTTAAGGVRPGAYWGYAVLHADSKGRISVAPYEPRLGLRSVPAGNIWAVWGKGRKNGPSPFPPKRHDLLAKREVELVNGLPKPFTAMLRFRLTFRARTGYRFRELGPDLEPGGRPVILTDVAPDPGGWLATYLVASDVPGVGGSFPVSRGREKRRVVRFEEAKNNRPPRAAVVLKRANGRLTALRKGKKIRLPVGTAVVLDASASRDPERRPLLSFRWEVEHAGSGSTDAARMGPEPYTGKPRGGTGPFFKYKRGTRVGFRLHGLGDYRVKLTVYDDHGAVDAARYTIVSLPHASGARPGLCGCCGARRVWAWTLGTAAAVIALAALALLFWWRGRLRGGQG
jgi:hypothetical protein